MLTHTRKIITLAVLLLPALLHARSNLNPSGAKAASMSNAVVSGYNTWAISHNPAGLAKISKTTLSIDYENRFLVPELSLQSFTATIPHPSGNFSFLYSSFGPLTWQESTAGLSYSRFLGDQLSCGITFRYFGQKLPETGKTASATTFDLGAIARVSASTCIGFSLLNPLSTPINIGSREDILPWIVRIGGHTDYQSRLILAWELMKEKHQKVLLKAGTEWSMAENFSLRFGIDSFPRFSSGIGFKYQAFQIDVAFSYHQYLGYSPVFTLQYELK